MSEQQLEHRFGQYGGQYVPETVMPALAELEAAWLALRDAPVYRDELALLLKDYAGRPTPLYRATRFSDRVGRDVYLKREDLMHTGAHKINNALGQALLAKLLGRIAAGEPTAVGRRLRGQHRRFVGSLEFEVGDQALLTDDIRMRIAIAQPHVFKRLPGLCKRPRRSGHGALRVAASAVSWLFVRVLSSGAA